MPPRLPSVLIVDDNQDFCESAFDCFERNGFDVNATRDAMTALHLARTGNYDVAVVDLVLPGVDGVSLFTQMRGRHPPLRGVLVTGNGSSDIEPLARQAGFEKVLYKPFELPDLLQTVLQASP